jgi:ubiquinone/menaquinone biosynthesis C-methylase UbiE
MDPKNKYTVMQQNQYDYEASAWSLTNKDPVVGSFDLHNQWIDYDVYLFKSIDTNGKTALDFGCGPGRNIVKFANRFQTIDGVDISEGNLEKALVWFQENNLATTPKLFKNNGIDLSNIKSESYDVVFSTICLQHICVYDIRYSLLNEFFRVLKPGGHFCAQMGFGPRHPTSVGYYENFYDAHGTNSACDVRIESVDEIKSDLEKIGFTNFEYDIRPVGPGDHHSEWIFFRARKP